MAPEITNVSEHGFWVLIDNQERFVLFKDFPWFREVPIGKLLNVRIPHPGHLYWPDLDVDLAIDSIDHPERYPLVSRDRPDARPQATAGRKSRRREGRPGRRPGRG